MCDELVKKIRHCATDPMHCLSCGEDKDGRCFKRLMTQAADALEELTALSRCQEVELVELTGELASKPRWIPVTERLPEDECPVLVTYLGFHDHKPRANMLAYIDRDLGWCWWDDDIPGGVPCSVEITHWQPLPEPPKEE